MEPGKTLLTRALAEIGRHEAWQSLLEGNPPGSGSRGARDEPGRPA
jgi:hypothetical protein